MASPIDHAPLGNKRVQAFFKGKTIERISGLVGPSVTFFFTDGTRIALTVDKISTGYEIVACEECALQNMTKGGSK